MLAFDSAGICQILLDLSLQHHTAFSLSPYTASPVSGIFLLAHSALQVVLPTKSIKLIQALHLSIVSTAKVAPCSELLELLVRQ